MAELAIEISKTAVQLVADKVKTAIKEEEEQWQIVERDLVFITGEFEMMQSFLDTADGERIRNHVVRTWVRQVRDLSYDVEDCIDFVLHLDPNKRSWLLRLLSSCSWPWSKPRAARHVDAAVADITQLKARVMDVSQRNTRYNLISDSGSKPGAQVEQTAAAARTPTPTPNTRAFNVLTPDAPNSKTAISDLADVINLDDEDLRVISVHATEGDLGTISVIRQLFYEDKTIHDNFACRAWVKLLHPFNPHEFIRNVVAQFLTNIPGQDQNVIIGVHVMKQLEKINLVDMFVKEVDTHRYLIVLEGVSSMEQWDAIRTYLPNRRNKSRIIVSTHHVGIARLCTGKPYRVSVLKQSSADHPSHIFYSCYHDKKGLRKQEQAVDSADLFGREEEIDGLLQLIQGRRHISVWGPPGIGKTTLMKAVFDRSDFIRRAWANVSDPFNGDGLSQDIAKGLKDRRRLPKPKGLTPIQFLKRLLFELERYLVVIDDLKSVQQWDFINDNITSNMPGKSCVVVITANESIATYCAQGSNSAVYRVKGIEADTALRLFEEKASSFTEDEGNTSAEVVWRLISMCSGLPRFITTIADHVAKKQRTIQDRVVEMRLLNDNFMHEMQNNPSFGCLKGVFAWLHSNFEASPPLLKKCIFYLSIFPRGSFVRRKRLVRRWAAEGFSGGTHWNTSLEKAELLIDKLVDLGVMQAIPFPSPGRPGGGANAISKKSSSCQVNSVFLEYIISRQMEERTFLPLEVSILEGTACNLFTQPMGRHLAIRSSWERDEFDFNSLDLSRLRSLTVSGKWQPFFISEKMRVLRVLDLEGTTKINVQDNSFKQIGSMLPRLKYLSLRGCKEVCSLPDSLGELSQLQTLDIRGTSVAKLPPSIVKLHKLQYISAGNMRLRYNKAGASRRWRRARKQLSSLLSKFRGRPEAPQGSASVVVPIGIEKLEALRTLSVINANASASGGEFVLRDVKKLTKLSKLGVYGLAKENSREFWSLVSGHKHMESLSVWGGVFPPRYVGFPPSLTKLTLDMPSCVLMPVGVRLLGELEKLRTLRIRVDSATARGTLLLGAFVQLKVLHVACKGSFRVKFPEDAMKGLEQLTLETEASITILGGLEQLGKLKWLRTMCLRFHKYLATDTTNEEDEPPAELQFGNEDCFGQLKVLEVVSKTRLLVKFPKGAMERLEQLTLRTDESIKLDGMDHLGNLKRLHTLCLRFADTDQDKDLHIVEEQQSTSSAPDNDDPYLDFLGRFTVTPPRDGPFGSLMVLEIACTISGLRVKFAAGAMRKLMKLTLRTATLLTPEDMKEIGKLETLGALRLDFDKCQDEEGELQFGEEQNTVGVGASSSRSTPPQHFGNLKVLEIIYRSRLQVKFAEHAMKNLERLNLHSLIGSSDLNFSGLDDHHLQSLRQVSIKASSAYRNVLKQALERQLVGHKNKPVVTLLEQEPHSS